MRAPVTLALGLLAAASGAQDGPWRAVNRYAVLAEGADALAVRESPDAPWADDVLVATGWTETVPAGTRVLVTSCGPGGRGTVCTVHTVRPDGELGTWPRFPAVVQLVASVPVRGVRLLSPVPATRWTAAGSGVPEGFGASVDGYGDAFVVGPTIDALNVRAGPSTDHAVLTKVRDDDRTAVHRLACADRRPGDRGAWCLAAVDRSYDPLDASGTAPLVGFVYTAALVPHVFDGGWD